MSLTLEIGHEQQGVRAAYVDGAPGLRAGIYNATSSLMFLPGDELVFQAGSDLMFDNPDSTYPGIKIEVIQ